MGKFVPAAWQPGLGNLTWQIPLVVLAVWIVSKLALAPYQILVEREKLAENEQERLRKELEGKTKLLQGKVSAEQLIRRITTLVNEGNTILTAVLKEQSIGSLRRVD